MCSENVISNGIPCKWYICEISMYVTGQVAMSPSWVGRVFDSVKIVFIYKKYNNLDNIVVYLITSLKSKLKKYE